MATLYINFFEAVENGVGSGPLGSKTITTSTTSAQSAVFPEGASIAQFFSDEAHYVALGTNPTAAAASGIYVPANVAVALRVRSDARTLKAAGITLA